MEQLLLQNSENIKTMLRIMQLHEENISRHYNTDTDVVMNSKTYSECEYASLPVGCIRPSSYIKPTDPMILTHKCGHTCRKEHFLEWIKTHQTCMTCGTPLI